MSRLLQAVRWGFEASLIHFHNGCKPLAVDSLYVYATAADGLAITPQVSVRGISITGHWLRGVPPSLSTVAGSGAFPHLCARVCSFFVSLSAHTFSGSSR